MSSFRTIALASAAPPSPLELLDIANVIDDAMRPGHFFVAPSICTRWIAARSETIAWEIFRGRLVDTAHTREQRTFLSWHILEVSDADERAEPMLSVKLDVNAKMIHVTRGLRCLVWEGYDAGGGVIESRQVERGTRELVGSIVLDEHASLDSVRDELICLIWQAFVGTSRLPLTSIEAPLPVFTFGLVHYVHHADAGEAAITAWDDFFALARRPELARQEVIRLIEFSLRRVSPGELDTFVAQVRCAFTPGDIIASWRAMFNAVSLSPYTQFVDNALAAIDRLADGGVLSKAQRIDFLSHLLVKLGRHLTAYDLVTFHHRGANYPDALMLDAVLTRFLDAIEASPALFVGNDVAARRRRRALRQGCLMRRNYEGHFVPDAPTSPGENARLLPASYPRVPEEQITQTHRRRRRLFQDDPLAGKITDPTKSALARSIDDLDHLAERIEMGLGVFIDRPLGYGKAIGEPDLTPLLAHEAFSPSIAGRRLAELLRFVDEIGLPVDRDRLQSSFDCTDWPTGLPHAQIAECSRPTAALCDVRKVADDFVILRTLANGLRDLIDRLDLPLVDLQFDSAYCVCGYDKTGAIVVMIGDVRQPRHIEFRVDVTQGFRVRAGVESPRAVVMTAPSSKVPRTK